MSESCPTRLANASSFRTVPARGGAFVTSALVGWEHNSDGVDPPLSTSDGVAVRSVWADAAQCRVTSGLSRMGLLVPRQGRSQGQAATQAKAAGCSARGKCFISPGVIHPNIDAM